MKVVICTNCSQNITDRRISYINHIKKYKTIRCPHCGCRKVLRKDTKVIVI